MPEAVFKFDRKGLQQQLATAVNLKRWGLTNNDESPLCGKVQTNKHVLSNCDSEAALKTYTVRHNPVLSLLANWIHKAIDKNKYSIHVDLPDISMYKPVD